jgi:hypothetical protein
MDVLASRFEATAGLKHVFTFDAPDKRSEWNNRAQRLEGGQIHRQTHTYAKVQCIDTSGSEGQA